MSEHAMIVRCIHCGTDKPPLRNESEYKDTEPWRCSECETSGTTHDFYLLESELSKQSTGLTDEAIERITDKVINQIKEEGRQAGIKEEREATVRYFKRIGKPYYVALFREGEHLK